MRVVIGKHLLAMDVEALQRAVRICGPGHLGPLAHGPTPEIGAVFGPQRTLLLDGAQPQVEILLARRIVVAILQIAVVQVVVAQRHGLDMAAGIVAPRGPDRKGLLLDARQIAQQILGVFPLLVDVEFHVVDAGQRQHGQFIVLRKTALDLHLPVDVVRQEGQSQHLEQQLQVGLPQREEIGRLFADVSAAAHPHLRGAQRRLEGLLFGVAVAQLEIEHRAHRPGPVGGKGSGVEADFAYQIGIDDAHRTARGTLRGEVVDVRNLDAVHVELVFGGSAATHDQIVAIAHGRERHARIGAYDTRDVAVRTGALLDLLHADDLQADGAFGRHAEGGRTHRHGLDLRGILLELDLDEGGGGRNPVFGGRLRLVTDRRNRQPPDAGFDVFEMEAAERIGRNARAFLPGQHHGGIGHRLTAQTIDHPPVDRIGVRLGPDARSEQRQQKRREGQKMDFTRNHVTKIRFFRTDCPDEPFNRKDPGMVFPQQNRCHAPPCGAARRAPVDRTDFQRPKPEKQTAAPEEAAFGVGAEGFEPPTLCL